MCFGSVPLFGSMPMLRKTYKVIFLKNQVCKISELGKKEQNKFFEWISLNTLYTKISTNMYDVRRIWFHSSYSWELTIDID